MTLFYKTAQKTAVGTAVDTPEDVNEFTLNDKGKKIRAFIGCNVEQGTVTTAEAVMGRFIVNSSDAKLHDHHVAANNIGGGGEPTNEAGNFAIPQMQLVDIDINKNAKLDVDYEITIESTGDVDAMFTVVYDDGNTPQDIIDALKYAPHSFPVPAGIVKGGNDVDIGDAASEDFADTITIPARFKEVIAIEIQVAPDAVQTAAEELLMYLELSTSNLTISSKDLQIPAPSQNASLGTAADSKQAHSKYILPLHIPLGDSEAIFTITAKLLGTTSGAYQVQAFLHAR